MHCVHSTEPGLVRKKCGRGGRGKTVTVQMMRMKKMRGAWKKTDKVTKRMLNDKLLI